MWIEPCKIDDEIRFTSIHCLESMMELMIKSGGKDAENFQNLLILTCQSYFGITFLIYSFALHQPYLLQFQFVKLHIMLTGFQFYFSANIATKAFSFHWPFWPLKALLIHRLLPKWDLIALSERESMWPSITKSWVYKNDDIERK